MNLTIRILGCEVLAIDTTPAKADTGSGDITTSPVSVGFTNVYGGHNEEDR